MTPTSPELQLPRISPLPEKLSRLTSKVPYVTGVTTSTDFPVTPDAIQSMPGGGEADAFVTGIKLRIRARRKEEWRK